MMKSDQASSRLVRLTCEYEVAVSRPSVGCDSLGLLMARESREVQLRRTMQGAKFGCSGD